MDAQRNFSDYWSEYSTISTHKLAAKIGNFKEISICHITVWMHMKNKKYSGSVPLVYYFIEQTVFNLLIHVVL